MFRRPKYFLLCGPIVFRPVATGLNLSARSEQMLRSRQFVVVSMLVVAAALCGASDNKSHHKPANSAEEVQTDVIPALETQEQIAPRLAPEQMASTGRRRSVT